MARTGWIRASLLKPEVGPGVRDHIVANGNIAARGLVKWNGSEVAQCGINDVDCVGINVEDEAKIADDDVIVAFSGAVVGIADVAINDGEELKCGPSGLVHPALTAALAGVTIEDNIGTAFTNQPANDGIEVVSASALDTMPLDIYGTTNGGVVVVKERITINGTTQVATTKVDWGVILGVEIPEGYPTSAGTITVREASGNATVTTLSSGTRRSGVVNVPLANRRAFNHIINVVADSGTTKTVGVEGTNSAGTTIREAVVLTGATAVNFTNKFQTVTKILVGDLESARTATFKTDTKLDGPAFIVGRALTDAAAGEEVEFLFTKTSHVGLIRAVTSASIAISNTTTETAFSNSVFQIPADALKMGRVLRIRGQGIATATNSTDTLSIILKIGSTALITIPATDVANNDVFQFHFDFVPRAVPGATAACVGFGTYGLFGAAGTATQRSTILASTNFATNAELEGSVTATWSVANAGNSVRLDNLIVELL